MDFQSEWRFGSRRSVRMSFQNKNWGSSLLFFSKSSLTVHIQKKVFIEKIYFFIKLKWTVTIAQSQFWWYQWITWDVLVSLKIKHVPQSAAASRCPYASVCTFEKKFFGPPGIKMTFEKNLLRHQLEFFWAFLALLNIFLWDPNLQS